MLRSGMSTEQTGWGISPVRHSLVSDHDIPGGKSSPDEGHKEDRDISYQVSRRHPSSLFDQSRSVLVNLRRRGSDLVDGGLVPWSGTLDVVQGLLQAPQLHLHLGLCLFSILERNLLEAFDGLDLLVHVVRLGLEILEVLLDLVDDGRVLQDRSVVAKVDGRWLLGQDLYSAAGIVVSLLEIGKRSRRAAAEAELRGDFAPVELQCCARLSAC